MARVLTVALFVIAGFAFGIGKLFDINGYAWTAFGVASLLCEPLWATVAVRRR